MHRVLSNLIENEIAHLPAGCHIKVQLSSQNGSAKLIIADNGPGFPPEITSRAFERFVRGKRSQGHGLGLAFVDAVVRAHGGTASISQGIAGGAVITLSLPANVLHTA
jgi:signal transduction histidine kinase